MDGFDEIMRGLIGIVEGAALLPIASALLPGDDSLTALAGGNAALAGALGWAVAAIDTLMNGGAVLCALVGIWHVLHGLVAPNGSGAERLWHRLRCWCAAHKRQAREAACGDAAQGAEAAWYVDSGRDAWGSGRSKGARNVWSAMPNAKMLIAFAMLGISLGGLAALAAFAMSGALAL